VTSAVALIGACTFHPATWSWLVNAAAAPVTPDALATSTGTLLGLTLGAVVVVVDVWGFVVVVVELVPVLVEPVALDVDGWIWPRSSTVASTKSPRRITARSIGNRWL
jgi:hypothetical protein